MLGFIFKCVHKLAPNRCCELFELKETVPTHSLTGMPIDSRFQGSRNKFQLVDPVSFDASMLLKRSIFGLVSVWNALPQDVVVHKTVKNFQKALTARAKEVLAEGCSIPDLCDLRWIHVRYGVETHFE